MKFTEALTIIITATIDLWRHDESVFPLLPIV